MKKNVIAVALFVTGFLNWGFSQSGRYLVLDGADDYMRVINSSTVNIPADGDFTLTCQIRLENGNTRIISKRLGGAASAYELISSGAQQYGVNLSDALGAVGPPFSTATIGSTWHHLALVVDRTSGTCSIYIDGVLDKVSTNARITTGNFSNTQDLLIGAWDNNGAIGAYTRGSIDEIRLWSKAFSQSELLDDQSETVDGPLDDLLAAWNFDNVSGNEVPDVSGNGNTGFLSGSPVIGELQNMAYERTELIQTEIPTAIGSSNQRVLAVNVVTEGVNSPINLTELVFNMNGTSSMDDVTNISLYYNGQSSRFDVATASKLADFSPKDQDIVFTGSQQLANGSNYFFIAYDIAGDATHGNVIDAAVKSVTVDEVVRAVEPGSVPGNRTIMLANSLLFKPGDGGAASYRIPAIVTAQDGSLIVAADKRNNGPGDLGKNANIDVVIRRSTDNGASWSAPVTIAGEGTSYCYSDPSLVVDALSGDILCLFNGNTGFFQSNQSDWVHLFVARSSDNGVTWSSPVDITDQIYGPDCANVISRDWLGAFITSGRLTQLRSGRIIGAMPVRTLSGNTGVYTFYSDDGGVSWEVSTSNAVPESGGNGNESKLIELDNDSLLMSIRTNYVRRFNLSGDGGVSWEGAYNGTLTDPGCNGDIIRYSSVRDGAERSILIHSLPNSPGSTTRQNVSLYLSYDEGATWPVRKTIDPGSSAYSSVTVLSDGSVGIFYEDGEHGDTYNLYFTRVSMDWLASTEAPWDAEKKRPTPVHSASLDGIDAFIRVEHAEVLNASTERGFTISGWVKMDGSNTAYQRIFSKRNGTGNGYELFTGSVGSGAFGSLAVNLSSPTSGGGYSNAVVNDNEWHHVAMVIDPANNVVQKFLDGKMVGANVTANISAPTSNFANTEPLLFGVHNNNGYEYFMKGEMDDIHIWSSALSEDSVKIDMGLDIAALKSGGQLPDNLVAAYDFEDVADGVVPDVTGNNHPGQFVGNMTVPVDLISFTATFDQTENLATVKWQTANEVNVESYVLEYSLDGINYLPVYTTKAKGGVRNMYQFRQSVGDLTGSRIYYRLRKSGLDGSSTYFDEILLLNRNDHPSRISVYPNPASSTLYVKSDLRGNLAVSVYSVEGKQLIYDVKKEGNFTLDITALPAGIYFLKVQAESGSQNVRFIKR